MHSKAYTTPRSCNDGGANFLTAILPNPLDGRWCAEARCRGKYVFYTDRSSDQRNYNEARKLCKRCPVKNQCLAYALINCDEFGFWSGLTPGERADFKREGARFNVDWSNMLELSRFRREYEAYRKKGNQLGINWKNRTEVTAFRLTYDWVYQPTIYSSDGPLYRKPEPEI